MYMRRYEIIIFGKLWKLMYLLFIIVWNF